jgi:uncharacterized cupin superfamily protein
MFEDAATGGEAPAKRGGTRGGGHYHRGRMVCHWDDVEREAIDRGELRGERMRLGSAAGAVRTGLSRYLLPPGARAMPVHVHGDEEEIFFVLAGEGLSWQDGRTYRVGAGDCVVHRAGAEAHTMIGGPGGLDALAFAEGSDTHLTWLPRAGVMWAGPHRVPVDAPHPYDAEAAAGALEAPAPERERPASIVALADVREQPRERGDVRWRGRRLGDAAGSARTGLSHYVVAPGSLSNPPHCHSAEEELFVVLEGDGVLLLDGEAERPVRAGHVVSRPAGTGVAHAFRAGERGLTLLAHGRHDPNDICFYPRSGKLSVRGVRAIFRIERADYWDGEA